MVERLSSSAVGAVAPLTPAAPAERTGDPRTEAFQRTLATMIGSRVPVSVLARMQDGSFMVRVAETPVRMLLPPGTQAGTQLNMTVLAATPQPTFGLGNATVQGTLLPLSANAASLAAAVAAASSSFAQTGGQVQGADLSPAARLLAQVLGAASGTRGEAAPALQGTAPLAPQGAPDPAQLAGRLQSALAQSGLFYESHLAQWAEGKRPLGELMAEPQARTAPGTPPTEAATAQLINQQLATHEGGQVVWQGQLGRGQDMRWTIGKDEERGQAAGDDEERGWQSGLRLRFAALGEIDAEVVLRGGQLHIAIQAQAGAAGLLRAGAARLEQALAAAGTGLAGLRIHEREDA